MAVVEIAAVRALALWLGEGRLVVGADPLDGAACVDHTGTLRALRVLRRWDMLASMKMLVAIHAGRAAFHRSAYHMMRSVQDEEIANLRMQVATDNFHLADLRARDAGWVARIDALEEELRLQDEVVDDLRLELAELAEAVAEARRADRPEPESEPEP